MLRIRSTATLSAALILAFTGCGDDPSPNSQAGDNNATTNNSVANNSSNNSSNTSANNSTTNNSTTNNATTNNDSTANNSTTGANSCDPTALAASTLNLQESTSTAPWSAEQAEDGTWTATLDAALGGPAVAAESAWLYVDLDNGELLDITDFAALESSDWELAFKRAEVRLNSGDSGPRSLLLTRVEGTDWETATPPGQDAEWTDDDFVSDDCDVETYGRGSAATAFSDWYDYNPETHAVSAPEGVVYFTYDPTTHAVKKVQITEYDSGIYSLRWQAVGGGQ